ncbi:MAG: hypothetical protein NZT92_03110 [Abditibacteriales bacterium]|nr:hypothetical protein [Abditibacteriales bacterium]MDW8364863.1 hypothetical protein [Abditibacteriales bacterium]
MVHQARWQAKLSGARQYQRLLETLDGLGRTFLCLSAMALVGYHLDRWLVFPSSLRLAWLIALGVASVGCALAFVLRPLVRRISDEDIALQVEKRFPQLQERLLSSVEFAHAAALPGMSPQMVAALMRQTEQETAAVQFTHAITRPQLRRVAALSCVMLLILTAHVAFAREPMARWLLRMLHPYSDIPVFALTQLDVQPRHVVLPRGADLTITVAASGSAVQSCDLYVQREGSGWEKRTARPQTPGRQDNITALFRYRLTNLTSSIRYYARARDGQSNTYTAMVVDRPAIVGVRMRYHYPAYTRQGSAMAQEGAGNIAALVGTRVGVEMTANKPVHAATLELNVGAARLRQPLRVEGAKVIGSLTVRQDGTYTVRLWDEHGFTNLDPPQYAIQAIADRAPDVSLIKPKTDLELVPDATLPLSATARDDYGIAALRLKHQKEQANPQPLRTLSLPAPSPPRRAVTAAARWNLAGLDLQPGDALTFFVEAQDNDNVTGPHIGKSEVRRVRIVSHEEMEMRLNALMSDIRQMLDRIIQRQRETKAQTQRAQANPQPPTISEARRAQNDIARETADAAQQLNDLTEQAENNALSPPEELQRQRETQQGLQNLAQRDMPQAAQSIERAEASRHRQARQQSLNQAAQQQQQILNQLQRMREALENRNDLERLAAQARELAQRQQALARQAEMIAPNMLQRFPDELPAGQRNLLDAMAQEQRGIREGTQQLGQQLQEAMQRQQNAAQSDRLNQAAQQMQQQRLTERQQSVERQMQQNQLRSAAPEANRLAQDLQNLAQTLQPPNPPLPSAAEMAQQFREMAERLGKLVRQQQEVVRQAEQRPNAQQSQQLAERERSIQREAERMAKLTRQMSKRSPSAGNMNENLQEASRQLQRAQSPLSRNQPQQALPSARAAQRALEQALQEAEDAAAQMEQQQQADALRQQLRDLAARQRGINQATQRLDRTQRERGQLPPSDQREAQQAARQQGGLAEETRQLQQRIPSQIFRHALGEAARSMERAQQQMERGQLGAPTQREQERAARLLDEMASALDNQSDNRGGAPLPAPRGMNQAARELQGALGDIRMLREVERFLNEQTREFEQHRSDPLTPEQQQELEQLERRQGNNANLTQRTARRLRAFPQLSRLIDQAGDDMRRSQQQLQEQETGEPAQQPQREAIRRLEEASGRIEQVLQQQQAQQMAQRAQQRRQRANQPALDSHFVQGSDEGGERNEVLQRLRGFGNLPPRAQRALREGAKEKVPAEYENLINQYYKALAKEKRK